MARPPIKTSLHGRRLGLGDGDRLISGDNNVAAPSTSATLVGVGVHAVAESTSQVFTLEAPVVGAKVTLAKITTDTAAHYFKAESGNFMLTQGSSFTTLALDGQGESVSLVGVSTSLWLATSYNISTGGMTTST